jgi:MFS family permease
MKDLLRDTRVQRLFVANTFGSIGSGITIFTVPWLLVHRDGGSEIFRWSTIGTTVVLFLFMPYYGAWVDRESRKKMVLISELFGFAATSFMATVALVRGEVATWQLVVTYFCGMLYYTLHYPAKFALIQQLFVRRQYQPLIGLIEIQGQTAQMIAGGLGGYLVDRGINLSTILTFDACTYAFSFAVQATLPYRATHLENRAFSKASSVWHSVGEGWRWLRTQPVLALFLTCSLMPFITVMASNYLMPVYVAQTLHADARVFGAGEIHFAFGAVIAGFWLPRLIAQHSAFQTIAATMLIFAAGLVVIVLFRYSGFYFAAVTLLGFGNAGCRVARSALVLNLIPNEVMGRVTVFYNLFDRMMRTGLVASLSIIDVLGPPAGFLILLIVVLIAYVGVLKSRHSIKFSPETLPSSAQAV